MFNKTASKFIKLSFILLAVISLNVQAEFFDSRVKKWEFFLAPQMTNSQVIQFDGGAEADISKRSTIAFGFGYNINHHIELDLSFASSNANYTSTVVSGDDPTNTETSTNSLYTSSINFGFTYNLLKNPFTPYISAKIGSTYIDSGVLTGNVGTGCWYYPYWGYVCGPVAQTYTSTELNYGAALGLRYDFNRKLYIKGDVGKNYIDVDNSNTNGFITYRFIFGFMF